MLRQIRDLYDKIASLQRRCCCQSFGLTDGEPTGEPVNDVQVLFDPATGILYYWDGDSWEVFETGTISDEAYGITWDGVTTEAPSKNAVYDKIEDILNGVTFTGDIIVPVEAYGASWDGSNEAPTKNDIYDQMELKVDTSDLNNLKKDQIGIRIDGNGAVISTGYKGRHRVPYSGTITGWTIIETSETPITSSIVVDVKLGTYANYDTTPTFASIAGTEKPTITNSERGQDLTLSTWTTAVIEGDFLEFTVDSVTDAESIMLFIHITKD